VAKFTDGSGTVQLECRSSTIEGQLVTPQLGHETIVFSGCTREGGKAECQSRGDKAGTIRTLPSTEVYTFKEQQGKYDSVLNGSTNETPLLMTFTCGTGQSPYSLSGGASAQVNTSQDAMTRSTEYAFGHQLGPQELTFAGLQSSTMVTLTTTATIVTEQPIELNTKL
jgi:hypothetical protein